MGNFDSPRLINPLYPLITFRLICYSLRPSMDEGVFISPVRGEKRMDRKGLIDEGKEAWT